MGKEPVIVSRFSLAASANTLESLARGLCASDDLTGAIDNTTVPAVIHNGLSILHINKSCVRWLGYPECQLLCGADLRVLGPEEDHASLLAAMGARSARLPVGAHIQRFLHFNGEPQVANVLTSDARLDGKPVLLSLLEPGSSTQRSSNLLRLLEEAVDHLHDIVFITEAEPIDDVGRRIVFVNRIFTLVTGYESNDVLGKTPNVTIGELTDRRALERIERGLKQKRPVHEELLKYGKHGDEYWVELDILPVFGEGGEHTHWVSVQRDITERKLLQQRFVENERLASAGLLSAKLAEELERPLARAEQSLDWLVKRLPELLEAGASPSEVAQALEHARRALSCTQRVASTTSHVKLLSGAPGLSLKPTDVREVLDNAVSLLQSTKCVPGRIERVYDNVPCVMGDPARLIHVFHFALESAAGALLEERAEHNTIRICVRSLADGIQVIVEDTGVGGASEVAEHLFTPFGRRRGEDRDEGVALFVANCLVRELGGHIELRSLSHGGTALEVFLPVVPSFVDFVASPAL